MSRIDDLRARLTPGGIQPVDFHGRPFEPMFKASEIAPLLDVASAAERAVRDVRADGTFTIDYRDLAALRAALDRLEASTHDASGGPPAPHRRPSEDPT